MKQSITIRLCQNVSEFGFYVLFPIFFFYHLAVTSGEIPGVFAGLFGFATAVLMLVFLPCGGSLLSKYGRSGRTPIALFLMLVTYCGLFALINHLSIETTYRDEAAVQVIALLVAWLALFVLGATLPVERARLKTVLVFSAVAMGSVALLLFDRDTLMFNPRVAYEVDEGVATYQEYARSFLVVELFLLSICSTFPRRIIVACIGAGVLFLLGARSELFALLALAGLSLAWSAMRSPRRFLALAFLGAVGSYVVISNLHMLESSRQLQVLDLESATSWIARQKYQAVAIRQIAMDPFLGSYAGHFEAGGKGTYAHNALSAWVEFGVVGFVLYLATALYCTLFSMRKRLSEGPGSRIWAFAAYVNFVATFLLLISKPVFWSLPAFGWGLVANALLRERGGMRPD